MNSVLAAPRLSSTGSKAVAHGLSCSEVYGRILLDQGSNPCLLHWQVGSLPLSHQGSPIYSHGCSYFLIILTCAVHSDVASLDPDTNNWYLLSFLFIILARGLSLLSLAKNQLLVSMIFLLKKNFFFYFIDFCYDLYYFYLLSLLLSFSSFGFSFLFIYHSFKLKAEIAD